MKPFTKRPALLATAALVALTFCYPPYELSEAAFRAPSFAGYAWIWSIPSIRNASVAWPILLVQWVGLAIIGGLLWFAFRAPPSK